MPGDAATDQEGHAHDHGPVPSSEWVLEGEGALAAQHLRTLAPTLLLNARHFDVTEADRSNEGLPSLFMIAYSDTPIGAVDFLPLPTSRTLMRLYLCSDLGTTCAIPNGDEIAVGFAGIWLERLRRLGFVSNPAPSTDTRPPLGFRIPPSR